MKKYIVKSEYIDQWSNDREWCENPVVTDAEIREAANGWSVSVSELLNQVDEIEQDDN